MVQNERHMQVSAGILVMGVKVLPRTNALTEWPILLV